MKNPYRIGLEALEARRLLSAVLWTGEAGDNLWHTPGNWSSLAVPRSDDDVTIDVAGNPVIAFTAASGDRSVGSLTARERLTISGGRLTVAGASAFTAALTISGGVLESGGTATVSAAMYWQGGTVAGSGRIQIAQGATLSLTTDQGKTLSTTIDNNGTATFGGNPSLSFQNGTFNNNTAGVFHWTGLGNMLSINGVNSFNNYGVMDRTSVSSGSFTLAFSNAGTLDLYNTPLLLFATGTLGGTIRVHSGALLSLNAAMMYAAQSTITGDGHITFGGGSHVIPAGVLSLTGQYNFLAGSITISDTIHPSNPINVGVGVSVYLNAPQSFPTMSVAGIFGGSGAIDITSSFTWTAGTLSGTGRVSISVGATLLSAGNGRFLSRTIDNRGSAAFEQTGTLFFSGGTFNNYGDLFLNTSFSNGAGVNMLNNYGTISKTTATNATLSNPFNNQGTLNVYAGSLVCTSVVNYSAATASITGGQWNILSGAALSFNGANITTIGVGTGLTLDGPGPTLTLFASLGTNRGTVTLANGRAFDFASPGGVFHNYGTFVKSGIGATAIGATISFVNTGVIRVAGGSLALNVPVNGGQLVMMAGGACVLGMNQTFASISNSGEIVVGSFTLTATSSYIQTGTGRLSISVSAVDRAGQVKSLGSAALDGVLAVTAINGFDAAYGGAGLDVTLVDAATRTGGFSQQVLPATVFGGYIVRDRGPDVVLRYSVADANADGGVDGADIERFLFFWEAGSFYADANGDGGVDGADLAIFFAQWEAGGG